MAEAMAKDQGNQMIHVLYASSIPLLPVVLSSYTSQVMPVRDHCPKKPEPKGDAAMKWVSVPAH